MDRKEKILRHINKNGTGIEIGPSYNPIAPKKEGYNVHIIDHLSKEELLAKYKDFHVDLKKIEEVDFIWKGEKYVDLIGKKKYYDWIIASHLIEHTPDLIDFFSNCDEILKDNGIISLAIPDKRYCFDHFRPITGISKIIDHHYQKIDKHTVGTVAEFYLNVVSKAKNIAWDPFTNGEYALVHSLDETKQKINTLIEENKYMDLHSWCFTPNSFRLIINDLNLLGLISFKEIEFYPTEGCEFFVTLGKDAKGVETPRLELLKMIEDEICDETYRHTKIQKNKKNLPEQPGIFQRFLKKIRKCR